MTQGPGEFSNSVLRWDSVGQIGRPCTASQPTEILKIIKEHLPFPAKFQANYRLNNPRIEPTVKQSTPSISEP